MLLFIGAVAVVGGGIYVFYEYGRDLPDYNQLADYEPPVVSRVHAGDGRLLAEFSREKRIFVPVTAMPKRVVKAFISAEDKTFYEHPGIDFPGVIRAIVTNIARMGSNKRPVGASTITQQVAKNFLLTNEVSITRKIKEAILAFRIEQTFSKDRILELYLNEIYLGRGAYGVAAAAIEYFNKSLDELTTAELAYLAGLPKAPNNYHPTRRPDAARQRRDYVVRRMLEDGFIDRMEADIAMDGPVDVTPWTGSDIARADYFVEEVRRELIAQYGEDGVYGGGLSVRTTLDPKLQTIADEVLRDGLIAYDRRHGWRGPLTNLASLENWREALARIKSPPGTDEWQLAVVQKVDAKRAVIGLASGEPGVIPLSQLRWARKPLPDQKRGPRIRHPKQVLTAGDVILVERPGPDKDGNDPPAGVYGLRQVPEISGGVIALDPHSGRVLAMSGGFAFGDSQFNRVTQAKRQPGSAFKPFIYLAALDKGYTPSSIVLDAPFVIDQGPGLGKWKPSNYSNKFYGPSPLRLGIEKSRNLMTVRLAQDIGIDTVAEYAKNFGIFDDLPRLLSMSLGAGETTLFRLTSAYGMLVNGGKRITPTLIDRIQDRNGKTVFRHDGRPCQNCQPDVWQGQFPPTLPDAREQVADPRTSYQVVSMLQGVVQRGTARRIASLGIPLGGKTGTTNDSFDTWFIGFSPDLVVGVFAGFDTPRSLGRRETGSSVAAPIFKDFMAKALEGQPKVPFRVPPGIRLVRVNSETGRLARPGDKRVILEAFREDSQPPTASGPRAPRLPAAARSPRGRTPEPSGRRLRGVY